jgi:hypothetical protein
LKPKVNLRQRTGAIGAGTPGETAREDSPIAPFLPGQVKLHIGCDRVDQCAGETDVLVTCHLHLADDFACEGAETKDGSVSTKAVRPELDDGTPALVKVGKPDPQPSPQAGEVHGHANLGA